MKTSNREVDQYPYSRKSAEHLISATQEYLSAKSSFVETENSFVRPGDELPFNGLLEDFLFVEASEQIEKAISNSFPEFLPITWDAEIARSKS